MSDTIDLIREGQLDQAKVQLEQHIANHPEDTEAIRLLARLLAQLGDPVMGLAYLDELAESIPSLPGLNFEIGVLSLAAGRTDEAISAFRRELEIQPDHADSLFNLAWALRQAGARESAAALLEDLVRDHPEHGRAWFNLGNLRLEMGNPAGACDAFAAALSNPHDPAAILANLGVANRQIGRLDSARDALERSLEINPDQWEAGNNLGNFLTAMGRSEDAILVFERALALMPENADIACNLALALKNVRSLAKAEDVLRSSLTKNPGNARVWNCLGTILIERNMLTEAEATFRQAIKIDQGYAEAFTNLGIVCGDLGRGGETERCFRRAHELAPEDAAVHSNLLFYLRHKSGISEDELFAEHRRFGEIQESLAGPAPHWEGRGEDPDRRLRIGYVSPDFCEHAVMLFFLSFLEHSDRQSFELYCYHTGTRVDETTARVKALCHHWRTIADMAVEAATDLIRRDGIDILVDLAGHSARNGLPIFARKPAPIQITWLGYPATTGLSRIDYRITDPTSDPPGRNEAYYSEQLLRVRNFGGFQPQIAPPPLKPPPALNSGMIRFGSFNKPLKISDDVLTVWCDILRSLEGSSILMVTPGGDQPETQEAIRQHFISRGIEGRRVDVCGHRPLSKFLDLISGVDIALDPFPYAGATTTMLTLLMGVPVIGLSGDAAASSFSLTALDTAGCPDLVSRTIDEYREAAVRLAAAPQRLAELRKVLRDKMSQLIVAGDDGCAAMIEEAYRRAWRGFVAGSRLPGPAATCKRGDARAVLAATGHRIALSMILQGRSVMHLADGHGVHPVAGPFQGDQATPCFCPGGRRLAFAQDDGRFFRIVVLDLISGGIEVVSGRDEHALMPSWSPDGHRLTWHQTPSLSPADFKTATIHVWDGSAPSRRLATTLEIGYCPVFSSTGDSILFQGGNPARCCDIYRCALTGGDAVSVYAPSPDKAHTGIPHEHGGRVVFEQAMAAKPAENTLAMLDLRGDSSPQPLSSWAIRATNMMPRFSPDGRRIVVHGIGPDSASMAVHVIAAHDCSLSRTIGGMGEMYALPRWSADGRMIAAEDRNSGTVVVMDDAGAIAEVRDCARYRGQRFLEIWNFDIY